MIKFAYDAPALIVGDSLVLADLHIGRESKIIQHGDELLSITEYMVSEIERLKEEHKLKDIIILGDVKEDITSIPLQVHDFFSRIRPMFRRIAVLKGNHDGGIEKISGINVLDQELVIGGVAMAHGHKLFSPETFSCDYLLTAHRHFYFPMKSAVGKIYNMKIYAVVPPNISGIHKKYGNIEVKKGMKAVFVPSFNPLITGQNVLESIRERKRHFENKIFKLDRATIYTLKGECLGNLPKLRR